MPMDSQNASKLVGTGRGFMSFFLGEKNARASLLSDSINPDRAIVAMQNGRAVGYATFKLDGKGPYHPALTEFRNVYGRFSGAWKYLLFLLLERRKSFGALYLCGLKVIVRARGQSIGRLLLEELERQAINAGRDLIELEVSSTNHEARRLYASMGYVPRRKLRFFWLARFLPFSEVLLLQKTICAPE